MSKISVIVEHRPGDTDWPTTAVFEDRADAEAVCRWLNITKGKTANTENKFYVRDKIFMPKVVEDTDDG